MKTQNIAVGTALANQIIQFEGSRALSIAINNMVSNAMADIDAKISVLVDAAGIDKSTVVGAAVSHAENSTTLVVTINDAPPVAPVIPIGDEPAGPPDTASIAKAAPSAAA